MSSTDPTNQQAAPTIGDLIGDYGLACRLGLGPNTVTAARDALEHKIAQLVPAAEVAQLRAELAAKNQELADEIEDHAATTQRLNTTKITRADIDEILATVRALAAPPQPLVHHAYVATNPHAEELARAWPGVIETMRATQGVPVPQPTTQDAEAGSGELRAESDAACVNCRTPIRPGQPLGQGRNFHTGAVRGPVHVRVSDCRDAATTADSSGEATA